MYFEHNRDLLSSNFSTTPLTLGEPALVVGTLLKLKRYLLLQVLARMVQEVLTVPGISRVLYDLTSKPPGTTEWE